MNIKEKISSIASNTDEELLGKRLHELDERAFQRGTAFASQFLTSAEVRFATDISSYFACRFETWGGYDGAERQIAFFLPEYSDLSECIEDFMCAVKLSYYGTLSHRDILGALLSLGIERSATGDILIEESSAIIILQRKISQYVIQNFTKAGHTGVKAMELPLNEIQNVKREFEERRVTVSSLRLDSITSSGFRMSRGNAQEFIQRGFVQLNSRINENASASVKEGDIISARGYGKLKLTKIAGESKKERIILILSIYK